MGRDACSIQFIRDIPLMTEIIPFIEFETNDGKLHLNCERFKEYPDAKYIREIIIVRNYVAAISHPLPFDFCLAV